MLNDIVLSFNFLFFFQFIDTNVMGRRIFYFFIIIIGFAGEMGLAKKISWTQN